MTNRHRKPLKNSTVTWGLNYPKDSDLEWSVKGPGETEYVKTKTMPFDLSKDIKYNKKNIGKYKSESNLNQFFN